MCSESPSSRSCFVTVFNSHLLVDKRTFIENMWDGKKFFFIAWGGAFLFPSFTQSTLGLIRMNAHAAFCQWDLFNFVLL